MNKSKGFTLVEIILALVAIGLIGGVSFYVFKSSDNSKNAYDSASKGSSSSPKSSEGTNLSNNGDAANSGAGSSIKTNQDSNTTTSKEVSLLNGSLNVTLPDKWGKESEGTLSTQLNNRTYIASFTLSDNDNTKNSPYSLPGGSGLSTLVTQKGTTLWVYRTDDNGTYYSWVYVSACQPGACSPKINGQFVLVTLTERTNGSDQKLYFKDSNSDANTILGQFAEIIKSSNL